MSSKKGPFIANRREVLAGMASVAGVSANSASSVMSQTEMLMDPRRAIIVMYGLAGAIDTDGGYKAFWRVRFAKGHLNNPKVAEELEMINGWKHNHDDCAEVGKKFRQLIGASDAECWEVLRSLSLLDSKREPEHLLWSHSNYPVTYESMVFHVKDALRRYTAHYGIQRRMEAFACAHPQTFKPALEGLIKDYPEIFCVDGQATRTKGYDLFIRNATSNLDIPEPVQVRALLDEVLSRLSGELTPGLSPDAVQRLQKLFAEPDYTPYISPQGHAKRCHQRLNKKTGDLVFTPTELHVPYYIADDYHPEYKFRKEAGYNTLPGYQLTGLDAEACRDLAFMINQHDPFSTICSDIIDYNQCPRAQVTKKDTIYIIDPSPELIEWIKMHIKPTTRVSDIKRFHLVSTDNSVDR